MNGRFRVTLGKILYMIKEYLFMFFPLNFLNI